MIRPRKRGKQTLLNSKVIAKIKDYVLVGLTLEKIAKNIGISENTLNHWLASNRQNLLVIVDDSKVDRMLNEAEKVSKEILSLDPRKENGTIDGKILAVQQKESAFLREKLVIARDYYSNTSKISKVDSGRKPVPILAGLEVV